MIKLADGRGSLYQWDTGRQVECDAEQVHFSNHHYGTSIDVNVQNGKATIPNQLLTSATPIKAWAWVKDNSGEYTKEEQIFIVAKRSFQKSQGIEERSLSGEYRTSQNIGSG